MESDGRPDKMLRGRVSLYIRTYYTDEVTKYVPKCIGLLVNGGMLMLKI